MKIAFSTVGCPGWKFSEIFATAKDLKFDGIEIRGIDNEMYAPKTRAFSNEKIDRTLQKLQDNSMEIPILSSGACIGIEKLYDAAYTEACDYIQLAQKISTPYIRIMINDKPQPHDDENLELAVKNYRRICDFAADKNVTPLIETNGKLADSRVMAQFIGDVNRKNSGILWDIHHPYRYFGESPAYTCENIGKYVRYTHLKDSVMEGGQLCYRMMGYGDVPITEAIAELKSAGYNGFLSLEWVKRWFPVLEDGGIVFAHYISYMTTALE